MGNSNSSAISLQANNPMLSDFSSQSINEQWEEQEFTSISHQINKLQTPLNFQASKNKFMEMMIKSSPADPHQLQIKSLDLNNYPDLTENENRRRFSEIPEDNKQNFFTIDKTISQSIAFDSFDFLKFIKEECVYDYYRVLQKTKKGERAEIYKVEEIETHQIKILKIVSKVAFRDKTLIKGISQIQNLLKLDHPRIVRICQAYEDVNKYYIILQNIEGVSLLEYMRRHRVSERVGKQIIKQVLEALQYIHNNGIIHRNIRLENIMIQLPKGQALPQVKLIDFGMSLTIQEAAKDKQAYGSIFYASPQSLQNRINTKYDIWSVGILTLILFWNSEPSAFSSTNYLHQLLKRGEIFKQHLKKLPLKVKQFVFEMLTLKNKRRPTAAEALRMEWMSGKSGLYKSRIRKDIDIDEQLSNRP